MFLLNLGHRWNMAEVDSVDGVMLLASGSTGQRLYRKTIPEVTHRLFDPQLYLASLSSQNCAGTCARLATYPWFVTQGLPEFDSAASNRTTWEQAVKSQVAKHWTGTIAEDPEAIRSACLNAIQFQKSLGCTHIILPSPLAVERENEFELQAIWLDQALTAAAAEGTNSRPVLATVALAESTLSDAAFAAGGLLEAVADQITSRPGLDGVYIVVAQTRAQNPRLTDSRVLYAYMSLAKVFSAHYQTVLTNFAGVFGLACMGTGASGLAAGSSHSARRLSLVGFEKGGGRGGVPRLYVHSCVGEFNSEGEVNRMVRAGLIRRIWDRTPYSEPLLDALKNRRTAASVPAWAESKGNLTASHQHFISRLATEVTGIARVPPAHRLRRIQRWLWPACTSHTKIDLAFEKLDADTPGSYSPVARWSKVLDAIIKGTDA